MFNLESINSDIRKIIEKIEKGEIKDLSKESIVVQVSIFQSAYERAAVLIRFNRFCLKNNIKAVKKDFLYIFGEPLIKQDLEKIEKQTKELSGLIDELCKLFDLSRPEMENEDDLLIKFGMKNEDD